MAQLTQTLQYLIQQQQEMLTAKAKRMDMLNSQMYLNGMGELEMEKRYAHSPTYEVMGSTVMRIPPAEFKVPIQVDGHLNENEALVWDRIRNEPMGKITGLSASSPKPKKKPQSPTRFREAIADREERSFDLKFWSIWGGVLSVALGLSGYYWIYGNLSTLLPW